MSAMPYMRALLWLRKNDAEFTDAEFIVRAAKPNRWPSARFEPSDVDRAAKAVSSDPHYLKSVRRDAMFTARAAGVGLNIVGLAADRLRRREASDA